MLMWITKQSAWKKTRRWCKRRYLRWFALTYWSYCWLKSKGVARQTAQVQLLRVLSGFNHASWITLMEDFIKPEYWPQ